METIFQAKSSINAELVPGSKRMTFLPQLFGPGLMLIGESTAYNFMSVLCESYQGGYWDFLVVPGSGYMRPSNPNMKEYHLVSPTNWFEGTVSADAAGIIVTMMALSEMCFRDRTDRCAENFHALRDFAIHHPEASLIFRAID